MMSVTQKTHSTAGVRSQDVTVDDIISALKKLRAGKACADDAWVTEMLKTGHEGFLEAIAAIFSDILHEKAEMPHTWCASRLTILFKKGDAKLPKNYRPIAIIPVLGKLFSGVLLQRIKPLLENLQEPEQAGFRADFSCDDVIHFLRMTAEKADEKSEQIWAVSLDLEKDFDKVLHSSVSDGLARAGVEPDIFRVLWDLYSLQPAHVRLDGDVRSRAFKILCDVRQGDHLSPILFNSITRDIFAEL